ncbi:hypothetical protein SAMN05421813_10375 [Daejeonella rubra]|uniref:Uncharacterized protein n=1 Tax=Daejeonella rubra TaxID=990371 RepID=A0A1G9NL00_9SPHI|nr:hypothetical protein SAMN05421813_10375 [Daejeonella rubra]
MFKLIKSRAPTSWGLKNRNYKMDFGGCQKSGENCGKRLLGDNTMWLSKKRTGGIASVFIEGLTTYPIQLLQTLRGLQFSLQGALFEDFFCELVKSCSHES